jgi:hypothetical protein
VSAVNSRGFKKTTLEANSLQNAYMKALFGSFDTKSLYTILTETQTLLEWANFFFQNLHKMKKNSSPLVWGPVWNL